MHCVVAFCLTFLPVVRSEQCEVCKVTCMCGYSYDLILVTSFMQVSPPAPTMKRRLNAADESPGKKKARRDDASSDEDEESSQRTTSQGGGNQTSCHCISITPKKKIVLLWLYVWYIFCCRFWHQVHAECEFFSFMLLIIVTDKYYTKMINSYERVQLCGEKNHYSTEIYQSI